LAQCDDDPGEACKRDSDLGDDRENIRALHVLLAAA
jgi:hypothetical protein